MNHIFPIAIAVDQRLPNLLTTDLFYIPLPENSYFETELCKGSNLMPIPRLAYRGEKRIFPGDEVWNFRRGFKRKWSK